MKFLCPHCERLVELRDFKVDGAVLTLFCTACQTSSRATASSTGAVIGAPAERPTLQLTSFPGLSNVVALRTPGAEAVQAAAEAARTAPFATPDTCCPKCISPRSPGATGCPSCGLTFNHFDPSQIEPPTWMKTAWVSLLGEWDDEEQHLVLRKKAMREQSLAALGRLYRLRLAARPEDPIAQRGRDEVLRLVLIPSVTPPNPQKTEIPSAVKYGLAIAVFLISVLFLVLMASRILHEPPG